VSCDAHRLRHAKRKRRSRGRVVACGRISKSGAFGTGSWTDTSPAARAEVLLKIANKMEENLELLAPAETIDNGKPIRETRNADVPLSIDHFRYFAACVRAEEGALGELDNDTVAHHFKEPLGVVGQIIPWNFPLLMAAWKLAPAVGAGNCTVIKPASNTPLSLPGAGVWSRNGTNTYRVGREIHAGRVWTNCYHPYPAGAAIGGYKQSGFGRETHKIILDHYQQTKNLLVSFSPKALGFF
jgi:acyl-CoA reductase-like NAD-dependent aldehyde dehydrogenase